MQSEIPASKRYDWIARGLKRGDAVVYVQDADGKVVWTENAERDWCKALKVGSRETHFLPSAVSNAVQELKVRAKAETWAANPAVEYEHEGKHCWFEVWVDWVADDEGANFIVTFIDITEQMHREQTLRTLLRELSHRSKNLLAIILSIATQTSRYTTTTEAFLERFRGRIQSLSSSQDLVTHSNWRGADLFELLVGQVQRYRLDANRAVRLNGRSLYLSPNAALHVGLALHELTVNSVSFGALGAPEGSVEVEIRPAESPHAGGFWLIWSERTNVEARGERERRFGTVALERVVPAALNSEAELQFDHDRFTYQLLLPPSQIEPVNATKAAS